MAESDDEMDATEMYNKNYPTSPLLYNPKDKNFTGWPPKTENGKKIGVFSDRWVWIAKDLPAGVRGTRYKSTYVNKGSVRTYVGGNGDPVIIQDELTGKFHYAQVHGNVNLISLKFPPLTACFTTYPLICVV